MAENGCPTLHPKAEHISLGSRDVTQRNESILQIPLYLYSALPDAQRFSGAAAPLSLTHDHHPRTTERGRKNHNKTQKMLDVSGNGH